MKVWRDRLLQILCFVVLAFVLASPGSAQESKPTSEVAVAIEQQSVLDRLQSIGRLIEEKRSERDQLTATLKGSGADVMQDERERLAVVNQDLNKLRTSFELVLLDDVDTGLMNEPEAGEFNWRDELVEVVEPLLSSLKSLTKRPRQLAELRKSIDVDSQRIQVAEEALKAIDQIPESSLNPTAARRLVGARQKWIDSRNVLNENLLVARSQLERLQSNEKPFIESLLSGTRGFLAGRGLTLLLATSAAVLGWGFMRVCWHVFHTRLTTRSVRRKATWYRLLAYSYHLLTLIVIVGIVLTVLYIRQDVLLMAVAFLMLAGAIISLRTFLPRFLTEVRILVNLGAVREDECVHHAGIPWQVMSLNIQTVLRNPAVEGVIKLPLEVMTSMVSRPVVRDEVWFPSQRGDYVLLPDQTFARVVVQTPELVELNVKGGMSMTIPSAEFYAMGIMNLSRQETYGIAVTFGLDYSLQGLSLSVIPEALKAAVLSRLAEAGFVQGKDIIDVLAEFACAGASSLDFLIYTTVSATRAADYFAVERLVQQACLEIANERQWSIPFPQMMLHHSAVNDDIFSRVDRAA